LFFGGFFFFFFFFFFGVFMGAGGGVGGVLQISEDDLKMAFKDDQAWKEMVRD